jgi:hypothetical protein
MAHLREKSQNKKIKEEHYKATVAQIATYLRWNTFIPQTYWHEGKCITEGAVVIDRDL